VASTQFNVRAPIPHSRPRDRGVGSSCLSSTTKAEREMSKGMDQKKTEKKKPEKSLKEKRAAKKEKKAGK
jgi:hypothetical protein